MAANFFNRSKTFSIGSLTEEKKDVVDTSNEEVDDSFSESVSIESISRCRANSSDGKSDISRVSIAEEGASTSDKPDAAVKWSDTLATPSTHAAYTPATDLSSKENLHGLGLKLAVERAKLLSRTGKGCVSLLSDVASLHDELSQTILKLLPSALETAAAGTPLEEFAHQVNQCITSFAGETQKCGSRLRQDVIRPWVEFNTASADKVKVYQDYVASRGKCTKSRKEALKSRQKYVGVVKDAEAAIQTLKKARATVPRKSTERSDASSSEVCEEKEGVQWEIALKEFGKRHGITKQCDSVAKALEEVQSAEGRYCDLVEIENDTVVDVQEVEKKGLDAIQMNEEERIIFMLLSLDRFLQIGRDAFDAMSLNLTVSPLNLDDDNHKELPVLAAPSSIFMTPRRRTQSEDGPAINETRMLNLPDDIAESRDNMKSHLGRQSARLKTLKAISSFNEGLAAAIEAFASGLHTRLENEGYTGKPDGKNSNPLCVVLNKNEGQGVLKEWNKVIQTLSAYATNASQLANHIKRGNSELYNILLPAKRELKSLYENEEARWKNLSDAAKGETQAKMKQKQSINDLQKAQARLSLADEGVDGDGGIEQSMSKEEDSKNSKTNFMGQSMKMNSQMNKAMGKMFAALPGGGEDVMNKMLKPEQRKAIMEKNLDEAKKKTAKAAENLSAAGSIKEQSITAYQVETEAALQKFKTNERYVWAQMQKSLENSVVAVRIFRDTQQAEMSTSDNIVENTKLAALNDTCKWVKSAETRVKEYSDLRIAEWKDDENEHESGFFLRLLLIDSSDIKELVYLVVNDNDDDFGVGFEMEYEDPEKHVSSAPLSEVPEDPIIKNMDPIFSKTLKNVSIDSYYSAGWSEEIPLYKPWLEKKGSFDVSISDWEKAEGGFKHEWSGEMFPQRRVIKFKFKRTTHLYIGPPIAGVTQTQYCRQEGNDRCVTMMTAEMDGIPYSDVFCVEVRWSARRLGNSDLLIDAGMHVRFLKSSMFASKIRSGTLTETKPIHLSLFETIKVAVSSEESSEFEAVQVEDKPEIEIKAPIVEEEARRKPATMSPFRQCVKFLSGAFLLLPQHYQVLSGVLLFGTVWVWSTGGANGSSQQIAQLNQKVDQLGSDLAEVKNLLDALVRSMEKDGMRNEL